jgi:hypothetical protein
MSATAPIVDDRYRRYAELLLQHHRLLSEGRDEATETEAVEEEMTGLWERMDDAQRRSLSGLGSDLNWVRRGCRPPPKGRQSAEVTAQELQALAEAQGENDWHGLLHWLRLCAPRTSPARLASLRASAWAALQFPQLARLFSDLAAELGAGGDDDGPLPKGEVQAPEKKLLFVRVRCINRVTKEFFGRDFWLELSTLPDAQRRRIEESIKGSLTPADFVAMRPLLQQGMRPAGFKPEDFASFHGTCVTDYFEDEAGNPLDEIALAQIMTGDENPILPFNVGSVLRLGPVGIVRKELWTVESANALAHFFQLVEVIGTSDWLKSALSISTPTASGIHPCVNSFECPSLGQMYSILLPVRQLYASDNAFNHACKVYLRHVEDERKRWWVGQTHKMFNAYLESVPSPHAIENYKVRELLDLVMYGAGLVHYSQSKPETRQHFKDAVTRHQREWVIFTFIMYCRELYSYANRAYFILRQDYEYWLSAEGCRPPDLLFMRGLFTSHRLRPDTAV